MNHIQLRLFMLSEVNIAILRPFQCLLCLTKLIVRLNHNVIFISLLFRIFHSLNHIQLLLFVLSKVDIALLRPFLCFRCLTKLIIRLNDVVIIISLLFRLTTLSESHSVTSVNPLYLISAFTRNFNDVITLP